MVIKSYGEKKPLQLLTFATLFLARILGLVHAWRLKKDEKSTLISLFFFLFSIGVLFTAMEEISWGQSLLGFETPASIAAVNEQNETTFHNLKVIHGNSEIFRAIFGIGGGLGVCLSISRKFRWVSAPLYLMPWFAIITFYAFSDGYFEYYKASSTLAWHVDSLDEVLEFLIGAAALLYISLKIRMWSLENRGHLSEQV